MKITKWLSDPMSERIGCAIIEVEPDEVADIEKMAVLVDGDFSGHFGFRAELKTIGIPPKIMNPRKIWAEGQFGFPPIKTYGNEKRYYEIVVHRD